MIEIEKPQIECIETPADITYGKYVVEPLERGYGTTLGNACAAFCFPLCPARPRPPSRSPACSMSSPPSRCQGRRDGDRPECEGLLTKLHCETVKTVYIEAVGPCEVKAGDIKADGEVEVLNPELHIATLGPDASLNMELTLSHGRGYVPADRNKPAQTIIGLIPVDSIYTRCARSTTRWRTPVSATSATSTS